MKQSGALLVVGVLAFALGLSAGNSREISQTSKRPQADRQAEGPSALTQLQWTAPGSDLLAVLTSTPSACLPPTTQDAGAHKAAQEKLVIGRTAFSSPFLLGGQAARMGLSCNSCHINGRDNPDFFLEGLSVAAGTADVTHSLFSKEREDYMFNPQVIPSLVDAGEKKSFGAAPPQESLSAFIESAIMSEFQGAPPEPVILEGLVHYVESLKSAYCGPNNEPQTVAADLEEVLDALRAASSREEKGDHATADFLVLSARAQLGRIHERYHGVNLEAERALLNDLAGDLGILRQRGERGDRSFEGSLADIGGDIDELLSVLKRAEHMSLYDEQRIKASLAEQESNRRGVDAVADRE